VLPFADQLGAIVGADAEGQAAALYSDQIGTGGHRGAYRGGSQVFHMDHRPHRLLARRQVIGQGAVKPAGKPDAAVNVPLTTWEARRLAMAVLAHLDAWEVITFKARVLVKSS